MIKSTFYQQSIVNSLECIFFLATLGPKSFIYPFLSRRLPWRPAPPPWSPPPPLGPWLRSQDRLAGILVASRSRQTRDSRQKRDSLGIDSARQKREREKEASLASGSRIWSLGSLSVVFGGVTHPVTHPVTPADKVCRRVKSRRRRNRR